MKLIKLFFLVIAPLLAVTLIAAIAFLGYHYLSQSTWLNEAQKSSYARDYIASNEKEVSQFNIQKKTEETSRAAAKGDKDAQYQMGLNYYGEANYEELSIKWLKKSAEQGHANAAYMLGALLSHSKNPANQALAPYWLQKATNLGSAYAANDLAILYHRGKIVKKDLAKKFELYKLAAGRGDFMAMYNLGLIYSHLDHGEVAAPMDYQAAADWYRKSLTAKPNPCAAKDLGILYATGKGVTQNTETAESLFKQIVVMMIIDKDIKPDMPANAANMALLQTSFAEYEFAKATQNNGDAAMQKFPANIVKTTQAISEKLIETCWK